MLQADLNEAAPEKTMSEPNDKTHLVDRITGHGRMRRIRKAEWTRRLVRENRLTVDDLI